MIDYKELRIGNWIDEQGLKLQVGMINSELFKGSDPIKITEEWLIKFGFETNPKSDYWTLYLSEMDEGKFGRQRIDVQFMESRTVAELCHAGVCFKIVTCNFVHQLQNLYFSLIGTELTVKSF